MRVHREATVGGKSRIAVFRRRAIVGQDEHRTSISPKNVYRISTSFEAYSDYIRSARGEFSVAKQCYVATHCGWFGDRAAVFLASGRPVVMQDTGWSEHLPCGEGLFAVTGPDEAAEALEAVAGDYDRHSRRARELALEHFDAAKVFGRFLSELGVD